MSHDFATHTKEIGRLVAASPMLESTPITDDRMK
jgi:hypothetical protein